jgi:hypothetical protein
MARAQQTELVRRVGALRVAGTEDQALYTAFLRRLDELGSAQKRTVRVELRWGSGPQRTSSAGGTSRPSAFAVLRLMTSSTFVDCCTGRSAGFSPLRMRPGIDTGQGVPQSSALSEASHVRHSTHDEQTTR